VRLDHKIGGKKNKNPSYNKFEKKPVFDGKHLKTSKTHNLFSVAHGFS
jgi:hypothetical protein